MKKLKIFLISSLMFLLTGCWQYRELDDMSLVGAIGIDKVGNEYQVSVQIINVKKQTKDFSGGDEAAVTVYEDTGKTIGEALNKIALQAPKELYIGHIDAVVVGEDAAKEGIREYFDFLLRDREVRKIYPFIIAKDSKAIDVLKVVTPLETLPSANLVATVETATMTNGTVTNRTFDNVLMCLYTRGRHPAVTAVEIINKTEEGNKTDNISSTTPETRLVITGPAILKDDKLVGYLTAKEGLGYNILRDMVEASVISFPCDKKGNYGSIKIDKPKVNKKTKINGDNYSGEIKVDVTATLTGLNCEIDLRKPNNLKKVEGMASDELKSVLEAVMYATQKKYKSDIVGFGEDIYRNNYKQWGKVEDNWDETFSKMKYTIETKVIINNTGSITNPARDGDKDKNN